VGDDEREAEADQPKLLRAGAPAPTSPTTQSTIDTGKESPLPSPLVYRLCDTLDLKYRHQMTF
jgi:hypothetical protein